MADGIYVGMSGAVARSAQLDAVADDLANAQTAGYKSAKPSFEVVLAKEGRGQLAYTAAVSTGVDLRPGATVVTGRPTDVVPDDGAFLTVALDDGEVGHTRDGRLTADAQGRLLVGTRQVLGVDGGPLLVSPGRPFSVDQQGAVLSEGQPVGRLALVHLEGPVERRTGAVLVTREGAVAAPVEVRVRTGELELGNASPLDAAVQMISAQRSYETSMQAIQTYRQLDARAVETGRSK